MIQKFQKLPDHIRHISIVSLIAFLVSLPALIAQYPDTQDTIFAFMAFRSFSEQFYAGEFYPRWLFDFYNFYGAPMFYYYPPLIFYFETLLDIVTLRFLPDLLILGITGFIMIMASGLACYAWLKDLYGAKRAFIPSIVYMLLPNHLAIDFYLKGTLTELSSYIWMPLLFLFIRRCFHDRHSWIVVAVLYAALITCTVPMALAFSPLLLMYAGYEAYKNKTSKGFELKCLTPFFALVVGFALAGFHIITAYLMTDFINQDKFWVGFYDPKNWFMCFFDCDDTPGKILLSKFTRLHITEFIAIFSMFLFCWKHKKNSRLHSIFWLVVATGALFMMSEYSALIWEHAPLVERIQFPWRLAVALDFVLVLFLAKSFPFTDLKVKKTEGFLLICILTMAVISTRISYTFWNRTTLYSDEVMQEHWDKRDYFGVYIPPFTDVLRTDLIDDPNVDRKIWIEGPQGGIQNIEAQRIPYGFKFEIDSEGQVPIHIRQLFYPTWEAFSENNGQRYNLSVSEPMGNITLDYTGGKNTIILKHKTVWQEKVGWGFTFGALLVVIGGYSVRRRKTA